MRTTSGSSRTGWLVNFQNETKRGQEIRSPNGHIKGKGSGGGDPGEGGGGCSFRPHAMCLPCSSRSICVFFFSFNTQQFIAEVNTSRHASTAFEGGDHAAYSPRRSKLWVHALLNAEYCMYTLEHQSNPVCHTRFCEQQTYYSPENAIQQSHNHTHTEHSQTTRMDVFLPAASCSASPSPL